MIILIADIKDLEKFNVQPATGKIKKILKDVWPGAVSVIMPIRKNKAAPEKSGIFTSRTGTLAFRTLAAEMAPGFF